VPNSGNSIIASYTTNATSSGTSSRLILMNAPHPDADEHALLRTSTLMNTPFLNNEA
jgi:hypothetical protein